ncbi:PREDICTED: uncharacterized protein LOC101298161 [Fragaria vesca subsp. vesca]|uniref:uncharacterized protein LOC101298161 n=1 Tax=Fragaria vesca subsp. vesca TaxID=101020 RepID=UPI0002C34229|nr:PREDICTED: uncharacterized protein LOC101298161 [Fragaria vesca subsp. vesca]
MMEKSAAEMESDNSEMDSDTSEMMEKSSADSDTSMDDTTYGYGSITVVFEEEGLCKEEDMKHVWKKEVEAVFEAKGLSCELKWDEKQMTVSASKRTHLMDTTIVFRAGRALYVLACGLSTQWVEPIVSGEIYTAVIEVRPPEGTTEDAFSIKYREFRDKVERKFELSQKLSCFILYHSAAVVVLSDKERSPSIISNLVDCCLMGDDPFDEDHFHELFLDE